MLIYKITNKINGKRYIGQTIGVLDRRWKEHCQKNSYCVYLKRAIAKYGIENFEVKVISKCYSIKEMNYREEYYIKLFNTLAPIGYNLQTGGDNYTHHESSKKKLSIASKKMWADREFKDRQSLTFKKTWEDPKRRDAARKRATGHVHSEEQKRKTSQSLLGHIVSEETRKKQSEAKKGKRLSLGTEFKKGTITEHNKRISKPIVDQSGAVYRSINSAAVLLKLQTSKICEVLKGSRKHTKGYTFKYLEDSNGS